MRRPRAEITRYEDHVIHVVGGNPLGPDDLLHMLLTAPWAVFLGVVVGAYLALNAIFALVYRVVGGVAGARTFLDAFFFSVQTMGTIGYGAMTPTTQAANGVVVVESVTGLVVTALATGLVFMRFSRTRAKVRFSSRIAIAPIDDVPTLMIRIGNDRRTPIVDASFRLTLTRTTTTREGVTLYRAEHLPLVHERAPVLARSMMLRHVIDAKSPMISDTPGSLAEGDIELILAASGTDEATLQPVHARKTWAAKDVVWGARLADLMSQPTPDTYVVDLRKFHDIVATEPTEDFPFPERADDILREES